jgi:hypothetical protein
LNLANSLLRFSAPFGILTNFASAFATRAIAFNVVVNALADGAAVKLPATAENVLSALAGSN